MRRLIGATKWKEIIETIEMHGQGLADTLAITADPKLQDFIKDGEKYMKSGKIVPLNEV